MKAIKVEQVVDATVEIIDEYKKRPPTPPVTDIAAA